MRITQTTYFLTALSLAFFFYCTPHSGSENEQGVIKKGEILYLNHSDSAKYVGMNACKLCHQDIYNSFIQTGMGKSFGVPTKTRSSGDFDKSHVFDKYSDMHYTAFWNSDSMFVKEFRLNKKDSIHVRTEKVNFIIGSGQHTNSHIQNVNGYFSQMPMTWYAQKRHWDLPPGFEEGMNTRFSRKIGLECMSCHNALPDFVLGSENKYKSVPQGIDCERCHGPGSIHLSQRQSGSKIDTSKFIDYSIVNPGKLSVDLQFDICQRCHLQGNAILKEGKSFYDFKPGKKLSDYISVFLPKHKGADEDFIMASHADRLKQSACYIKTLEKSDRKNLLRPYKDALTCVTCHNPHVSVRETNPNVFNDACSKCHGSQETTKSIATLSLQTSHRQIKNWKNCVSCHMPVSGSTDIPHVTIHDHYIRKPISQTEKEKIKTFVGLYSVNEKNPDYYIKAKAYLNQYEKFEQKQFYLDSAEVLLSLEKDLKRKSHLLIQLYFIKKDYSGIKSIIEELGEENSKGNLFNNKSYDNADAWACYRISEAMLNLNYPQSSQKWLMSAVVLAPFNLEFRNKLATSLAAKNDLKGAAEQFEYILKENPKFGPAYANLGYIKLLQGFPAEAHRLYTAGLKLDPDNEQLLLNIAAYYLKIKENNNALIYLKRILDKNPRQQQAKMAIARIKKNI